MHPNLFLRETPGCQPFWGSAHENHKVYISVAGASFNLFIRIYVLRSVLSRNDIRESHEQLWLTYGFPSGKRLERIVVAVPCRLFFLLRFFFVYPPKGTLAPWVPSLDTALDWKWCSPRSFCEDSISWDILIELEHIRSKCMTDVCLNQCTPCVQTTDWNLFACP